METKIKSIFIADDNIIDRMILEKTLNNFGYSVKTFENGESILNEIMNEKRPVLAILDWLMPDMDGIEVCKSLARDPPVIPVYLIIVTSRTDKSDIAYALNNGADDFVSKPYNHTELMARVNVGIRLLTLRQLLIDSNANLLEYTRSMESLAAERAEQLVRADRLSTIGILSAGMAHEINNPSSFVAINIQTLEENMDCLKNAVKHDASEKDIESARAFIAAIPEILSEMKSGMTRIRTIVNGLKTYSHMSHEKRELFNIEVCINSALHLCENRLKYHVTVNKTFNKVPEVFGDINQIEQVFINLFTNAADAIDETGKDGKLFVTTEFNDGKVITQVRDTGPGIHQNCIDKIFMPFFTTKPIGKGTGLGLSISRNIITDHKGDLTISNHPDGGAVFTITFNASKASDL